VVKALAAGADFVMVGSLLSGTDQAPGKLVKTPEGNFKQYRGMASRDAQMDWRKKSSSPEGVSSMVPWKGDVNKILEEMKGSIKSGLSYSGARTLHELQTKAHFIRQTDAGQSESSAHILKRYR
jgi:IMP dehydrogenase